MQGLEYNYVIFTEHTWETVMFGFDWSDSLFCTWKACKNKNIAFIPHIGQYTFANLNNWSKPGNQIF